MTGWAEGLGPWEPVLKDGKLYGRGGADDGYAMFGALSAILALKAQGVAHARCAILIEACEESGSYDLPAYVDTWRPASARPRWWSASTAAAPTTTSCGSPRRCAA
ncbi:MAG: M20/M25/M40 family metallo-hydrolase [Caulobacteraceae bacterium]